MAEKTEFLTYKGKPLVRKDKTIYYGDMADEFIVMLQIGSTKKEVDMEIADKISLQLIATDPLIKPSERIIKKSEKSGLYEAMDVASVWLSRALQE